jgi:hypothetical protein
MLPLLPAIGDDRRSFLIKKNNAPKDNERYISLETTTNKGNGFIKGHNLSTGGNRIVNHSVVEQNQTQPIHSTAASTLSPHIASVPQFTTSVHSIPANITFSHTHTGNFHGCCGCGHQQQVHSCCTCSCNHNIQVHQCCHCHCQPQQQQQQVVHVPQVQYIPQPTRQVEVVKVETPKVVSKPRAITPPPPPPPSPPRVLEKVVEHVEKVERVEQVEKKIEKAKIHVERIDDDSVKLAVSLVRNNNETDRKHLAKLNLELSECKK